MASLRSLPSSVTKVSPGLARRTTMGPAACPRRRSAGAGPVPASRSWRCPPPGRWERMPARAQPRGHPLRGGGRGVDAAHRARHKPVAAGLAVNRGLVFEPDGVALAARVRQPRPARPDRVNAVPVARRVFTGRAPDGEAVAAVRRHVDLGQPRRSGRAVSIASVPTSGSRPSRESTMMPSWSSPMPSSRAEAIMPAEVWP